MADPKIANAQVLAAHPLLAVLEPEDRRGLVAAGVERRYRAGRTFLKEGDPPTEVFFLLEGAVRVFHRRADGRSSVLVKLFRSPALFGEMEVLVGRPFLEYVRTIEPTTLLAIPAAVFRRALRDSPAFAEALALDLAARLCIATCNERALAFHDLDTRLANLLLDYAALCGEPDGQGGTRLAVKLSQEGLAQDLAVSRRALGTAMDALRSQGIVAKERGRYRITDGPALARRVSADIGLFFRSDEGPQTEKRMRNDPSRPT